MEPGSNRKNSGTQFYQGILPSEFFAAKSATAAQKKKTENRDQFPSGYFFAAMRTAGVAGGIFP